MIRAMGFGMNLAELLHYVGVTIKYKCKAFEILKISME